jgi:hypothetical protein
MAVKSKNTLYSNFWPERMRNNDRASQGPRAREWLDEVLTTKRQKEWERKEPGRIGIRLVVHG